MNLSDLETPKIIEELSLNEILEQMRNKLIELDTVVKLIYSKA